MLVPCPSTPPCPHYFSISLNPPNLSHWQRRLYQRSPTPTLLPPVSPTTRLHLARFRTVLPFLSVYRTRPPPDPRLPLTRHVLHPLPRSFNPALASALGRQSSRSRPDGAPASSCLAVLAVVMTYLVPCAFYAHVQFVFIFLSFFFFFVAGSHKVGH